MNRLKIFLRWIVFNKYALVRLLAGIYAGYFFVAYLLSLEDFILFRDHSRPGIISDVVNSFDAQTFRISFKALLILLILQSALLSLGFWTRLNSLFVWFGYTFCYNFAACINQPHLTYFIYILMTYALVSKEEWLTPKSEMGFKDDRYIKLLAFIYMTQMSLSGFSKLLTLEWRNGQIFSIMMKIRDPEPGLRYLSELPTYALQFAAFFVLGLECFSIFYLPFAKFRLVFWLSHVMMYMAITIFVPHANHVAAAMLIFSLLILDERFISTRKINVLRS